MGRLRRLRHLDRPHPAVTGTTDYSCVRNNIVAIGDVNTWNDKYLPGTTRTDSNDTTRSSASPPTSPTS